MKVPEESQGIVTSLLPILEKLPVLSCYAKTRGWHYVIIWLHRFTGIGLVICLMVSIYRLSLLQTPDVYNAEMKILAWPILVFLAWTLSLVVSFHALNGGRLILYELFGKRNDAAMIRWTFGLSVSYAAILGLLMIMNSQSASAVFFWLLAFFAGVVTAYAVASRLWKSRHSVLWKLQRISGAFLFIPIPAYLLYLSLNPGVADEAQAAIARMQNVFVRIVYLALAASALYHSGYGLFSIAADYVASRAARAGITALIVVVIAVLAFMAFRLTLSI
jgi:succinate dehydrogenase hydrophobic anchor subunit